MKTPALRFLGLGAFALFAAMAPASSPPCLVWNVSPLLSSNGSDSQWHGTALATVGDETFVYRLGGNRNIDWIDGDTDRIFAAPLLGTTIGAWFETGQGLTLANGVADGRCSTGTTLLTGSKTPRCSPFPARAT